MGELHKHSAMSIISAILPAAIGLICFLKPETMFIGSKVHPTPQKLAGIRKAGKLMLIVAAGLAALAVISIV